MPDYDDDYQNRFYQDDVGLGQALSQIWDDPRDIIEDTDQDYIDFDDWDE